MKITKSFEDYLEAIYVLELKKERIQSIKISKMLDVTRPSVHAAMEELANNNFIIKEPYSDIKLTKKGREIAIKIYHKHSVIKSFLMQIGVDENIAEIDCCKIEHILSEESFTAIEKLLKK